MDIKTYKLYLKVYSANNAIFEKNEKDLKTAKIFAEICTARILKAKQEEERKLQIEKGKIKQEEYKDVVTNYRDSYSTTRQSLTRIIHFADSSRIKSDLGDTLSSLDHREYLNRDACVCVETFINTDLESLQEPENEPNN